MYFPYFRGRQYELLALKELASDHLISNQVIPVIEPIKFIPSLFNTIQEFKKSNNSLTLIVNPEVGELTSDTGQLFDFFMQNAWPNLLPAVLLNGLVKTNLDSFHWDELPLENVVAILRSDEYLNEYYDLFSRKPAHYVLCPYDRELRRHDIENCVLFEDKFKKQARNADYPEEEAFSKDHLNYNEDGYVGFGDYSVIGHDYMETGFAPYAVAIHIVYFSGDKTLRIKHFVSDTNEDISNVAGKFYEAVTKLNRWFYSENMESQKTRGLDILLNHYKNRTYPGLPTLKKLSIMHHLELMSRFLDGRI